MPLKKAVEKFKRTEQRRRNLALLRNAYGNALSDSNLGRMRNRPVIYVPRDCHTDLPRGKLANAYSWQMSNTYNAGLRPNPTSPVPDDNALASEEMEITRRYNALQRQARTIALNQLSQRQLTNVRDQIAMTNAREQIAKKSKNVKLRSQIKIK